MRFLFIMATIAIVTLVGCTTQPAERPRTSTPGGTASRISTGRTPSRIDPESARLLSIRRARAEPERDRADSGQTRGRQND